MEFLELKSLSHEDLSNHFCVDWLKAHKSLSHEDLSNHFCVDWLKAHEAPFSRDKTLEAADLPGIPWRSVFGPVNYQALKEFGSSGLIVEHVSTARESSESDWQFLRSREL